MCTHVMATRLIIDVMAARPSCVYSCVMHEMKTHHKICNKTQHACRKCACCCHQLVFVSTMLIRSDDTISVICACCIIFTHCPFYLLAQLRAIDVSLCVQDPAAWTAGPGVRTTVHADPALLSNRFLNFPPVSMFHMEETVHRTDRKLPARSKSPPPAPAEEEGDQGVKPEQVGVSTIFSSIIQHAASCMTWWHHGPVTDAHSHALSLVTSFQAILTSLGASICT